MSHLSNLVESEHSKKQVLKIVKYVGKDQSRFDELLKITLGKDFRLSQCAAWSLSYCVEAHPEVAGKNLNLIIKKLINDKHPAVQRSFTKILSLIEIPEKSESALVDNCFLIVNSIDAPIANRAFAAYAIEKVCRKYPEMYQELISSLQAHSEVASPGMKAVMRKILKNQRRFLKNDAILKAIG